MLKQVLLSLLISSSALQLVGQVKVGIITDLEENAQSKFIINELIQQIDKTTGVNTSIQSTSAIQYFDIS